MPYKNIEDQRKRKREYAAERRAADPTYGKAAHLLSNYGMRLHEFESMFAAQDGRCKLCDHEVIAFPKAGSGHHPNRACVDHCHTTNKIRGILCAPCNSGLGYFRDRTEVLGRAIAYLNEFKENTHGRIQESVS